MLTGVCKRDDLIAIVAPSSPFNKKLLLDAITKMEEHGFKFIYNERIFERSWEMIDYLVGSPQERAKEIMQYFKNPKVKVIIAARGGYGANLVAEYLDYDLISKNPKIFVGFSDLTFLLNAINKNSKLTTFHGPMLGSYRFLSMSEFDFNLLISVLKNPLFNIITSFNLDDIMNPESIEGTIIGGNLTLLTNLLGTSYDVSYKNKILFIEDTNEPPYKIHRSLVHLKQAGKFDSVKAIIFGEMLACGVNSKILFDILEKLQVKVPILTNFPAGHGERNVIIPIGGSCTIDIDSKKILMRGC